MLAFIAVVICGAAVYAFYLVEKHRRQRKRTSSHPFGMVRDDDNEWADYLVSILTGQIDDPIVLEHALEHFTACKSCANKFQAAVMLRGFIYSIGDTHLMRSSTDCCCLAGIVAAAMAFLL